MMSTEPQQSEDSNNAAITTQPIVGAQEIELQKESLSRSKDAQSQNEKNILDKPLNTEPFCNTRLYSDLSLSSSDDSDYRLLDEAHIIQSSNRIRSQLKKTLPTGEYSDSSAEYNTDTSDNAVIEYNRPMGSMSKPATGLFQLPPLASQRSKLSDPVANNSNIQTKKVPIGSNNVHIQLPEGALANRIYPFRKRNEKNLHPYTKLVWTKSDEGDSSRHVRRDLSVLTDEIGYRGSRNDFAQAEHAQEDSEDTDYIPGETISFDTHSNELPIVDYDPVSMLPSPDTALQRKYGKHTHRRRPIVYNSRRKKRKVSLSHKEERLRNIGASGLDRRATTQNSTKASWSPPLYPNSDIESFHGRSNAATNTIAQITSRPINNVSVDMNSDETMGLSSSLLPGNVLDGDSSPVMKERVALFSTQQMEPRRRRLVRHSNTLSSQFPERKTHYYSQGTHTSSGSQLEGASDSGLPTSKARRLKRLTKSQIRGVLPFSFMRDLNQTKDFEIQEEVGRWRHRDWLNARARRVLSSPSGSDDATASPGLFDHALLTRPHINSAQSPGMESGSDPRSDSVFINSQPFDLFSDTDINPGYSINPYTTEAMRPHFEFNYMDIYGWQFPLLPLKDIDQIQPPDFLRIAARESRRKGIRAKGAPDNPYKKAMSIEARSKDEFEEGDVAQSILATWRLGLIDIRRVFFLDENENEDEGSSGNCNTSIMSTEGPLSSSTIQKLPESPVLGRLPSPIEDPIMISDGEAIEDNRIPGLAPYGHRNLKHPNRLRNQHNKIYRIPRPHQRRASYNSRPLGSVINEFSGFDSDESKNITQRHKLPPRIELSGLPFKYKLSSADRHPNSRRRQFLSKFARPGPGGSSSGATTRRRSGQDGYEPRNTRRNNLVTASISRGRRPRVRKQGRSGHKRVENNRELEFLFDDGGYDGCGYHSKYYRNVDREEKPRQTRLLAWRSLTGTGAERRQPDIRNRHTDAKLDDVVSYISGLNGRTDQPAYPHKEGSHTHSHNRPPLPVRTGNINNELAVQRSKTKPQRQNASRKSYPKKVQLNRTFLNGSPVYYSERKGQQSNTPASQQEMRSNLERPHPFEGGTELLQPLPSGTHFTHTMWISKGGLYQTEQIWQESFSEASMPSGVGTSESRVLSMEQFSYEGVLSISMDASAAEFAQAFCSLCVLWYERIASEESMTDKHNEMIYADVMGWTKFAGHFLLSVCRSSADIALITQRVVQQISGYIGKLERLVQQKTLRIPAIGVIAFSSAVVLHQLDVIRTGRDSKPVSLRPRAIDFGGDNINSGEVTAFSESSFSEDKYDKRLTTEVSRCLYGLVNVLSFEYPLPSPSRLSLSSELWVSLIHLFPGAISSRPKHSKRLLHGQMPVVTTEATQDGKVMSFSPGYGVWDAVIQVSIEDSGFATQQARNLWLALFHLLPLSQINSNGIAAPRAAKNCMSSLVRILELAIKKQFSATTTPKADHQLRKEDEILVHQVYLNVHSIVTVMGIEIGPDSHIHRLLYNYLESRRFSSLSIEPVPSLPRFFTRYTGNIPHTSSPYDSCTILWLKTLDTTMEKWILQLNEFTSESKEHKLLVRDIRSLVSKLLPTRLLKFKSNADNHHLSTLANYYSVFLFFLHAVPSGIVRATRLYTQLQTLLKFRESTYPIARRVYFEAWSSATMILAENLAKYLGGNNLGSISSKALILPESLPDGVDIVPVCARDHYNALVMAFRGWGESIQTVIDECVSGNIINSETLLLTWQLVDLGLMYLCRVFKSPAIMSHQMTLFTLVYMTLMLPQIPEILKCGNTTSVSPQLRTRILVRILDIVKSHYTASVVSETEDCMYKDTEIADKDHGNDLSTEDNNSVIKANTADNAVDDSQFDFPEFDSIELLAAAQEAEDQARRSLYEYVDKKIVQMYNDQYIPEIRRQVMSAFTASGTSGSWTQKDNAKCLKQLVQMLVYMVSLCADNNLRAWDSFLDEYGRDSWHLIPDRFGRRLVLCMFASAAADLLISRKQLTSPVEGAMKDSWFSCICDLRMTVHAYRLSVQLWWLSFQNPKDKTISIFSDLPIDQGLVDSNGIIADDRLTQALANSSDYSWRAALATSFIDSTLRKMSQVAKNEVAQQSSLGHEVKHIFSTWVEQLIDTQHELQAEEARATHGLSDRRTLVADMTERVALLVRDHCAGLFLPSNLALQTQ